MGILEICDLSCRFSDGRWGLQNISAAIETNAIVVCTGANGAGKTLLARHLVGLVKPTRGKILLDGQDIGTMPALNRRIGLVFQHAENQIVQQTVAEDIAFGPHNIGCSAEESAARAEMVMRQLHLLPLAHRNPRTLSGGELRRVAIAGMMALRVEFLIVDEPFVSLDARNTGAVCDTLIQFQAEQGGLFIITHDVARIAASTKRLLILSEGRLAADDTPAALCPHAASHGLAPWGRA